MRAVRAESRRGHPSVGHRGDVRVNEIISLEQQRLTARPGQRVTEAVAEVEPGGMPSLAVPTPGLAGDLRLLSRDRLDGELRFGDEEVA